ncbi:TonB-dependent receptor [Albitalea terrae]|uniref:TonB-dependent receptor n=2 Tax=Piscinibacter terrae TaxID=2496871 RepID=A0A3N7HST2_9BURK|nr:TonB-dependent receptor [Albitalea terrae]
MCLLGSAVHAQTTASADEEDIALLYGDKSTVSIATGSRQSLRRAPAVATVITAQDIAAMGATDLDEVLETVPGVHVARNAQAYTPLYTIRGIYSELNPQTLVLQNGVPMTTLLVGNRGVIWGGLPLENIARIEIIRGPGSALYGADAFAGVINIITKGASDTPGTEFGVRAGSFKTRDGWIQHGGKLGPLDVAGYLRVGRTAGFKETITADAQTGLDAVFGTHASLAPGTVNTGVDSLDAGLDAAYGRLRVRAGYKLRDDMGTGPGIASALDPVGRLRSERLHGDVTWSDVELANDWRMTLTGSYFQYIQHLPGPVQLFPPGAFGGSFPEGMFGSPNTWERQVRVSAVVNFTGFADHNLRLGVGHDDLDMYRTQELKNFTFITSGPATGLPVPTPGGAVIEFPVDDSFIAPHRRQVNYVYVQDEWNIAKDWTLTGGVRRDQYSDFGGTTNPRIALVWDASLELTAKLLYGSAFRAPSFNEQYGVNPVASGNPSVMPETIKTLETAVQWQANKDLQVNMSVFRYEMEDIIRTTPNPAPAPGSTFQNAGAQRGHGAELEMVWDARRSLRLTGHYAYQRSIDKATGLDPGYAPHHHLYARSDWTFSSGWLLSGQLNYVADRKRAAGDTRPDVPDYTTLDLTLRSNRGKHAWELAGSVRNLFNADVREPTLASIPNDLPMPRRSLYLQAAYRF